MSGTGPPATSPSVVTPPGTSREELARLWSLGWPVSLGGIGMLAMGLVDIAVVGMIPGEDALAALAVGNLWVHGTGVVARGVLMGLDPVVSQAFGARDDAAAARALRAGLVTSGIVSVGLIAAYLLAGPGLRLLGQPDDVLPIASEYAASVAIGVPASLAYWAVRQFLQGLGVMKPASWAILWANLLNLLLDPWLVFGGLGVPALGPVGAGYATAASQWFMLGLLLWLSRRELAPWWRGADGVPTPEVGRLMWLGGGIATQMALEVWAFNAAGVLMGWFGKTELAAHQVALALAASAFMIPLGLSAGAATRVGNLIGAGHDWRRTGWLAIGLGGTSMIATATLFGLAPELVARWFSGEPEVVALAASLLPLAGAFALFDGVQVMCFGVLRGAGDVHVPTVFNLVVWWFVALPLAVTRTLAPDGAPIDVWRSLVLGLILVSILLVTRVWWVGRRGVARVSLDT
jgi:MATE family multidrug resistance protein